MRQINTSKNEAAKIGGAGTLEYQLWVNESGSLYVQLTKNTDSGTASQNLFPVAAYASKRNSTDLGPLRGITVDGEEQLVENNNVDAFLRAVLRDLLDGGVVA